MSRCSRLPVHLPLSNVLETASGLYNTRMTSAIPANFVSTHNSAHHARYRVLSWCYPQCTSSVWTAIGAESRLNISAGKTIASVA